MSYDDLQKCDPWIERQPSTRNLSIGACLGEITEYKPQIRDSFAPHRSYNIYENLKLAEHKYKRV